MKQLLVLPLLLLAASVSAAVVCTNENTAVTETTPTADFSDSGGGTVVHTRTGLMWMRCSLGQTWDGSNCNGAANVYGWQLALQAATNLNSSGGYAGYNDWRLPNKNELESIFEERCWAPSVNEQVFPNTPNFYFWSSSPYAGGNDAWSLGLDDNGYLINSIKVASLHVRLVRGGL